MSPQPIALATPLVSTETSYPQEILVPGLLREASTRNFSLILLPGPRSLQPFGYSAGHPGYFFSAASTLSGFGPGQVAWGLIVAQILSSSSSSDNRQAAQRRARPASSSEGSRTGIASGIPAAPAIGERIIVETSITLTASREDIGLGGIRDAATGGNLLGPKHWRSKCAS